MNQNLKAIVIYTVLAFVLTWPLVMHIGSHYPSAYPIEGGDPNMYIWFMDAVAKKVQNPSFHPGEMIFYPNGLNLMAGYEAPLVLLVSTPIILLTQNPVLAYNVILLLGFILTCFACYLLILYLTKSFVVALITGFSFGFSPYMMVRSTQHLDLLFLFTVIFVLYFVLKTIDVPDKKNFVWLILAVFLTAMAAWYYLVGSLIMLFILGLFKYKEIWQYKWRWFWTLSLIGILLLIFAIPMFLNKSSMSSIYVDFLVNRRGTEPANFFVPHAFMQSWTWPVYRTFPSPFEATSYFGLVGLIAIFVLALGKFKIPNRWFWISTIVVFTIISIGNYWELANGKKIWMPFSFLSNFVPFDHVRSPNRFFIFTYLSATVVFAYFLAELKDNIKFKRAFKYIFLVLLILLLSERAIFPYPLVSIPVSEFYKTLGESKEKFAIIDIPLADPGRAVYDYYQVYHKKAIVHGEYFWTSYNANTFDFIKANGLLSHAFSNPCSKPVPIKPGDKDRALKHVCDNNIRYVVVHNLLYRFEDDCVRGAVFVHNFFENQKPVFSDGEITVYATKP